jgi:hypothetical protein
LAPLGRWRGAWGRAAEPPNPERPGPHTARSYRRRPAAQDSRRLCAVRGGPPGRGGPRGGDGQRRRRRAAAQLPLRGGARAREVGRGPGRGRGGRAGFDGALPAGMHRRHQAHLVVGDTFFAVHRSGRAAAAQLRPQRYDMRGAGPRHLQTAGCCPLPCIPCIPPPTHTCQGVPRPRARRGGMPLCTPQHVARVRGGPRPRAVPGAAACLGPARRG